MKNNDVFCCCVAVKSTREKEMSVFSRDCNIVILVLKFWKIPFHGLIQEFSKFPTKQSLISCKISQNFEHLRSRIKILLRDSSTFLRGKHYENQLTKLLLQLHTFNRGQNTSIHRTVYSSTTTKITNHNFFIDIPLWRSILPKIEGYILNRIDENKSHFLERNSFVPRGKSSLRIKILFRDS